MLLKRTAFIDIYRNTARNTRWSYHQFTSNWRASHTASCRRSSSLAVTFHFLLKRSLFRQGICVWAFWAKANSRALPGSKFSSFMMNPGRGGLESFRWNWMKIDARCYASWGEVKSTDTKWVITVWEQSRRKKKYIYVWVCHGVVAKILQDLRLHPRIERSSYQPKVSLTFC